MVTAEPPVTVKTIDCVHQTGPMKAAQHSGMLHASLMVTNRIQTLSFNCFAIVVLEVSFT